MADFRKQVLAILQNIHTPGSFVSHGDEPFVFPGMVVKGMREISFPIPILQIKQLIGRAHKAPFGKGDQTLLDTTIRSAWEIDAATIRFSNKDWKGFIQAVVEKAKVELGVAERQVSVHFYKLLIYEKGDFFLPHQDSEKEAGMFGTLIIGLPSHHEGASCWCSLMAKRARLIFPGQQRNTSSPTPHFMPIVCTK